LPRNTPGVSCRNAPSDLVTLRHYDDVGLLAPASVDVSTGYRRYRRDQIGMARLIAALRWIDLPIHKIRAMAAPGAAPRAIATVLRQHRQRLEREQRLLADQLRDTARMRPVQIKLAVDDADEAAAFTPGHSACGTKSSGEPRSRRSPPWCSASTGVRTSS
jgi:DNA-binding transcriptional MerR regulator